MPLVLERRVSFLIGFMLKGRILMLFWVWTLAHSTAMAQQASHQSVAHSSQCWAVKDLTQVAEVRATMLEWAGFEGFGTKPMLGDAFVLESPSEDGVVIFHPFVEHQLIRIAVFEKRPGAVPAQSFERLEARLRANPEISSDLVGCAEIGHDAGRVYF